MLTRPVRHEAEARCYEAEAKAEAKEKFRGRGRIIWPRGHTGLEALTSLNNNNNKLLRL